MNDRILQAALIFTVTAATALVVSGCGTRNTTGDAAPPWDPCTAFPESALQDLGMNYKAQTQLHGQTCGWAKLVTGYNVNIFYRTQTDFSDWSDPEDPSKVTIGSYDGHVYHLKGNSHPFMCAIQLATKNANVVFTVTNTNYQSEDPCAVATQVANGLEKYLPPAK
ncbi:DUF3558 family protein [Nocardia sp. NPDC020380]|uniref:DUF3558 family protein n=1 Tax=Nocardia sp. NPDC020380 TaxID=3364309 RepID=UPI0037B56374